ncbi:MAG: hypothetical protein WCW67_03540 [Candidatus Margulisiibacteriota bacterium]|jgi:hypothetical protein
MIGVKLTESIQGTASSRFWQNKTRHNHSTRSLPQLAIEAETSLRANDPELALRDFHQRHIIRIVDLYKASENPVLTSDQLADLRQSLLVNAFRLAADGVAGNFALGLAGSVAHRTHPFLSDIDAGVFPAREEDREAAINVEMKMAETLNNSGIEMDWAVSNCFENQPLSGLSGLFETGGDGHDRFAPMQLAGKLPALSLLLDLQLLEIRGGKRLAYYECQLGELRQNLFGTQPEQMVDLCWQVFTDDLATEKKSFINLKADALRPFGQALSAVKVKYQIKADSPWVIMQELYDQGLINSHQRKTVLAAFNYVLGIRHIIGFSLYDAVDSIILTPEAIEAVARVKKTSEKELLGQVRSACRQLLVFSSELLGKMNK